MPFARARVTLVINRGIARYNAGRYNKSLDRSGTSGLGIRKTRMLLVVDCRPVNSIVMRGNSIVMKSLASVCWLVIAATFTLASDPPRKLIETRSSPTGWEADMGALDLLSNVLHDESGTMGVIFVYGSDGELASNVNRRIRCFQTYMTDRRGVPANRIHVMRGGYRQHATIELWVVPPGAEAPKSTPTFGREDVKPAKRGTRYRCDN